MSSVVLLATVLMAGAGAPPPRPSVAVLGFAAKQGMGTQVADILTENTATALRNSGRFSRVVSASDVTLLLSLEAQKQMLNCDSAGCVAEIAGALGTDLVCTGTVAQIGSITVLNARIVAARTGQTLASVGRNIQPKGGQQDVGVVLLELPVLIKELLAGLDENTLGSLATEKQPPAPMPAVDAAPAPKPASPAREPPAQRGAPPAAPASNTTSPLRVVAWGVAGVGLVGAVVAVVLGLAGIGIAIAMPVTSLVVPGSHKVEAGVQAVFVTALGVAAVALPVLVVALVTAGAAGVTAWVMP